MISFDGINGVAVLIGIVLSNALGFLWYGPLFGNTWRHFIRKSKDVAGVTAPTILSPRRFGDHIGVNISQSFLEVRARIPTLNISRK